MNATPSTEVPWINSLGMKFVPVPGTRVLFAIWQTRVKDYATYARSPYSKRDVDITWQNPGFTQRDDHPVVAVSYNDASDFCSWLATYDDQRRPRWLKKYRLPTDAEWSWAVGIGEAEEQAGANRTPSQKIIRIREDTHPWAYPWGRSWPPPLDCGNYSEKLGVDSFDKTSPVGSFEANPQGLFDLGGNVWEWCEDHPLRGASWYSDGRLDMLSSFRNDAPSDSRNFGIGFRCVIEVH